MYFAGKLVYLIVLASVQLAVKYTAVFKCLVVFASCSYSFSNMAKKVEEYKMSVIIIIIMSKTPLYSDEFLIH